MSRHTFYKNCIWSLRKRPNATDLDFQIADAMQELLREFEELDFLLHEGGEESVAREIENAYERGFDDGVASATAKSRA